MGCLKDNDSWTEKSLLLVVIMPLWYTAYSVIQQNQVSDFVFVLVFLTCTIVYMCVCHSFKNWQRSIYTSFEKYQCFKQITSYMHWPRIQFLTVM